MAAAVGAVAGADSSDDPHAAASNVTRTTLTPTAKRIDRRPGPNIAVAEFTFVFLRYVFGLRIDKTPYFVTLESLA